MMKYVLHHAKEVGKFDVFNCLSTMENTKFVADLKFGVGDGTLNFYMYNYGLKGSFMKPDQLAISLV
jgi:glycylpeptide N-tetradecanoyltransferase